MMESQIIKFTLLVPFEALSDQDKFSTIFQYLRVCGIEGPNASQCLMMARQMCPGGVQVLRAPAWKNLPEYHLVLV